MCYFFLAPCTESTYVISICSLQILLTIRGRPDHKHTLHNQCVLVNQLPWKERKALFCPVPRGGSRPPRCGPCRACKVMSLSTRKGQAWPSLPQALWVHTGAPGRRTWLQLMTGCPQVSFLSPPCAGTSCIPTPASAWCLWIPLHVGLPSPPPTLMGELSPHAGNTFPGF